MNCVLFADYIPPQRDKKMGLNLNFLGSAWISVVMTTTGAAMKKLRGAKAGRYLRMSTDIQDLSIEIQDKVLTAFELAHGITTVATYEDRGRSGLEITKRSGLRKLLRDVASPRCPFTIVLVYDVARWGRFEDIDAPAYYEYHCRMNGVDVLYVNEKFDNLDPTSPVTAIYKQIQRIGAADESRKLSVRCSAGHREVMHRGFQMGWIPCIGISRITVSKSGVQRILPRGDRKPHQTDRIKWVPGPDEEVALVKRIFTTYATTDITMKGIVNMLRDEGATARGRPFTEQMIYALLRSEAFIGNFVWGRVDHRTLKARVADDPAYKRSIGVIEPIVDPLVWNLAQQKRARSKPPIRAREQLLRELAEALGQKPDLTSNDLTGYGCATVKAYMNAFGSFTEALRLAGRDIEVAHAMRHQRSVLGHRLGRRLQQDIDELLSREGVPFSHLPRQRMIVLENGVRIRFSLCWKLRRGRGDEQWHVVKRPFPPHDYCLLVRMNRDESARDFVLVTADEFQGLPVWFDEYLPSGVAVIQNSRELIEIFQLLAGQRDRAAAPAQTRRVIRDGE
jgi:DNA invertase Pin-like site-specific DNA recombinase